MYEENTTIFGLFCLGITSSSTQGLILNVYSGINHEGTQRIVLDAGDWTQLSICKGLSPVLCFWTQKTTALNPTKYNWYCYCLSLVDFRYDRKFPFGRLWVFYVLVIYKKIPSWYFYCLFLYTAGIYSFQKGFKRRCISKNMPLKDYTECLLVNLAVLQLSSAKPLAILISYFCPILLMPNDLQHC